MDLKGRLAIFQRFLVLFLALVGHPNALEEISFCLPAGNFAQDCQCQLIRLHAEFRLFPQHLERAYTLKSIGLLLTVADLMKESACLLQVLERRCFLAVELFDDPASIVDRMIHADRLLFVLDSASWFVEHDTHLVQAAKRFCFHTPVFDLTENLQGLLIIIGRRFGLPKVEKVGKIKIDQLYTFLPVVSQQLCVSKCLKASMRSVEPLDNHLVGVDPCLGAAHTRHLPRRTLPASAGGAKETIVGLNYYSFAFRNFRILAWTSSMICLASAISVSFR